jgi:hypothetical protein
MARPRASRPRAPAPKTPARLMLSMAGSFSQWLKRRIRAAGYYSASCMTALTLPLAALAAGLISFSSPCCLPLVPGYLSYVSALPVSDLGER